MLWPLIKASLPAKSLLLLALAVLFWLVGWHSLLGVAIFLALEVIMWRSSAIYASNDFIYSKDILKLFSCDGQKLRVGMDSTHIRNIEQIKLWQDQQYGFIDFALGQQLQVRYKFPLEQYQALQLWLQQHLPATNLETSLALN
ncbi:MAG: hypothetical protein PHE38_15770 [Alishewanella agri]|nr:hypothetical protein [Alishewanella agri]